MYEILGWQEVHNRAFSHRTSPRFFVHKVVKIFFCTVCQCVVVTDLHSSCDLCRNQPFGVVTEPI